jgi:DNA-binding LacI/PurR family transcriptional regulator
LFFDSLSLIFLKKLRISLEVKAHVTLKQIAQELNVSVMTVSRALNNHPNVDKKTREKVLQVAKRLGYIPNFIAKSLVKKKTYTIGVVVPEITYSFFPEAIRGIEEIASSHGYQLILAYSAENAQKERSALITLASKRVDGILISIAETKQMIIQYINKFYPLVYQLYFLIGVCTT